MSSLHVLLIPSAYPTARQSLSGVFVREQAQALAQAGLRVGLIFPEWLPLRQLRPASLRAHRFQIERRDEGGIRTYRLMGWNLIPRLYAQHRLWNLLVERLARDYMHREGRPDVIHAHNALWGGVAARRVSQQSGIPYVVTEHSSRYRRGMANERDLENARRAYAGAAAVIGISRAAVDDLLRLNLFPPERVQIVPDMADFELFTLPPARPAPTPFRFIDVTLLDPIKRIDWLLQAFARAFPDGDSVALDLTGAGPERPRLEALARDLGLAGRVCFLGQLKREGVRNALWNAHGFVHASAYETFGIAPIEAMATGLPVLATDGGGPRDTVTPEVGRLVPVDDQDAFVEALRWAREVFSTFDPAAVRRHAEARFSGPAVATCLREIYQRVAKKS